MRISLQSEGDNFASKSMAEICHGLISSLCYTILLWSISSEMAPVDVTGHVTLLVRGR